MNGFIEKDDCKLTQRVLVDSVRQRHMDMRNINCLFYLQRSFIYCERGRVTDEIDSHKSCRKLCKLCNLWLIRACRHNNTAHYGTFILLKLNTFKSKIAFATRTTLYRIKRTYAHLYKANQMIFFHIDLLLSGLNQLFISKISKIYLSFSDILKDGFYYDFAVFHLHFTVICLSHKTIYDDLCN